jgi:hypothetical protein
MMGLSALDTAPLSETLEVSGLRAQLARLLIFTL